jgi:hypothetical protein
MRLLISLMLLVGASGCAATCPVIRTIADACPVIVEYLGEDGQKHQVQVPTDMVMQVTAMAAMRQGVAAPRGAAPAESDVIEAPSQESGSTK